MRLNHWTALLFSSTRAPLTSSHQFLGIASPLCFAAFVPPQNKQLQESNSKNFTTRTSRQKLLSKRASSSLQMVVTMDSPSAQRNKGPIWSIIESNVLPLIDSENQISALEIAAGCGVHTTFFVSKLAEKNMNVQWTSTDPDPESLQSLKQRLCEFEKEESFSSDISIQDSFSLTLCENGIIEEEVIADKSLNLMLCINMIHISPWSATIGLFKLASQVLKSGGVLFAYGPYKQNGTAVESNMSFDRSLKGRNPDWGVRDLEEVINVAKNSGLSLSQTIEMPANNLSLIFIKD